jgi:hypothetical protein
MIGLIVRDFGDRGQGCIVEQERSGDGADTGGGKLGGKIAHAIGVQFRIAGTGKDQIAVHPPALHRSGQQDLRDKAMAAAKPFQSVKRGDRLGGAGGGQGLAFAHRLKKLAAAGIGKGIAHDTAQTRRFDQGTGCGA